MFKSIGAFFMSIIIFVMNIFIPTVPEAKSLDEILSLTDICRDYEISDKLYVIRSGAFKSHEERHLAVCLQGVVAKIQPLIYIITSSADTSYLAEAEKSGIELIYKDENGADWTVFTLLEKFADYITDKGYVLYRDSENAEGLNMATNLATLYGWLPVHKNLEEKVKALGLEMKEDFSDDKYNAFFQWNFFRKHKKEFSKNAAVQLRYEPATLRDLAIQQGFFCFYIDEDEDGEFLRNRVLAYLNDNAAMLGWAKHEVNYVNHASKSGKMVLPSDFCNNNSFLASFFCAVPGQKATGDTFTNPDKHYCALVFSDGDNLQWVQNGYTEYFRKLSLETNFPMTWSFSPVMQEFSSATVKRVYEAAGEKDYFIAGVSGAGYIHPTQYPKKALAQFTDMTAAAMHKSNLNYVSILDSTPDNFIDDEKLVNSLEYYARYDNIRGGVLSLDPARYEGGKGRIFFVNDKPFATYRMSLWYPTNEMSEVTKEWIEEQADIVNDYPADIKTINGYSIINVHPWTISVDNLAYFVSCLDENVELLTLDEIMTMMSENIPHENVKL